MFSNNIKWLLNGIKKYKNQSTVGKRYISFVINRAMVQKQLSTVIKKRIDMMEKMINLLKSLHKKDELMFEVVKIRECFENREDIRERIDQLEDRLVSSVGRNPFINS